MVDQPIVLVNVDLDSLLPKSADEGSQDPCEDERCRAEAERQRFELKHCVVRHEPKESSRLGMHRNMEVRIGEVYCHSPETALQGWNDGLDRLHLECRDFYKLVERLQVYHRPTPARCFRYDK